MSDRLSELTEASSPRLRRARGYLTVLGGGVAALVATALFASIPTSGWLVSLVAVVLGAGALALVATRRAWMRPAVG